MRKALSILGGTTLMIIVVAIPLLILSQYAAGWGVPYFTFTTERGSTCTNDWAGYHCDDVTLKDLRWWGELPLPESTRVVSSYYKATHDFRLEAVVEVPKEDARSTAKQIRKKFGRCQSGHPTSLPTDDLKRVCVMANDATDAMERSGPMANTLYVITTGRQSDGTLMVGISEESR